MGSQEAMHALAVGVRVVYPSSNGALTQGSHAGDSRVLMLRVAVRHDVMVLSAPHLRV